MKHDIPTAISLLASKTGQHRVALPMAALVIATTGYWLWKQASEAARPWRARTGVLRYLAKQAYTHNFKVNFPFPSRAEMAKVLSSSATKALKGLPADQEFELRSKEYLALKSAALALEQQADLREAERKACASQLAALSNRLAEPGATNLVALPASAATLRQRLADLQEKVTAARSEWQARQQALAPVADELQAFQARWQAAGEADGSASARRVARAAELFTMDLRPEFDQAATYQRMYRLIGQELWVARRLLASANPGHQRVGVTLALDASRHALEDAQNGWVAARICEGYILPHLGLAGDAAADSIFNPDSLRSRCADIFRQNLEVQNVIRTHQTTLSHPATTRQADQACAQVARACEEAGELKEALHWLRQIHNTNEYRWVARRLPELSQQVARR